MGSDMYFFMRDNIDYGRDKISASIMLSGSDGEPKALYTGQIGIKLHPGDKMRLIDIPSFEDAEFLVDLLRGRYV